MPNILYKYSKALGMLERNFGDIPPPSLDEWHDSKDHAYITYYLCELAIAHDSYLHHSNKLKEVEKTIDDLDKTFGHLKEKYPEEFV